MTKHEIVLTQDTYTADALKRVIGDLATRYSLDIEVKVA